MTRILAPVLIALAVVSCIHHAPASSGSLVRCVTNDAFSDALRDWAVRIARGGDSTAVYRHGIGIPVPADAEISFVSDPALCDLAARKHAAAAQEDTLAPFPVHLLRLGRYRYIAFNGLRQGEFRVYFVFDQSFNLVTSYMM